METVNSVYVLTDEGREFTTLAKYDTYKGKIQFITSAISWDIVEFATNSNDTKAAFMVNGEIVVDQGKTVEGLFPGNQSLESTGNKAYSRPF